MNKSAFAILVVGIATLAVLVWYLTPTQRDVTPPAEEETSSVALFYYSPSLDEGPGGIACSRDGLVSVVREVDTSENLIDDTIELLLQGNLSAEEIEAGVTTEFPLEGFALVSSELQEDGTLTLTFSDPQNKTVGGACRVSVLWYQIEETALQFPEVSNVEFLPEELFQP